MTDKELLELAAKAAGIDVIRSRLDDPANMDMLISNSKRNIGQIAGAWNPLTDDGDAFRLAVKLHLEIFCGHEQSEVASYDSEHSAMEWQKDDPLAATRRAIVRAAAEIGKGMK